MKNVFLCLLFLAAACISAKKFTQPMSFDWQGHRGCRGLMPGNTIPAMLHAVDVGVTTLAVHAVIIEDRQVILSRDSFFNHNITTKPDGTYVNEGEEKQLNLCQMTYEEVKRYDMDVDGLITNYPNLLF